MAAMALLRCCLFLFLFLGVEQSLSESNSFHVVTFGGWKKPHQVNVYNVKSRRPLCTLKELPKPAKEAPFGSTVDGNITVCGGGIEKCFALTQDSQQWLSVEGVRREFSSAITTFDRGIWTFVGGATRQQKSTYSVFTEDSNSFSNPIDLGFNLEQGACTVRFNSSHAIISKGSDNVWWYPEDGHKFEAWSEKGGSVQVYSACGLVNRKDGGAQLVLASGMGENEDELNQAAVFDFERNEWHDGQPTPLKMLGATSVQFQNTFLTLGGHDNGNFFNYVFYYNAEEGWTELDMHLDTATFFLGVLHIEKGKVDCS